MAEGREVRRDWNPIIIRFECQILLHANIYLNNQLKLSQSKCAS